MCSAISHCHRVCSKVVRMVIGWRPGLVASSPGANSGDLSNSDANWQHPGQAPTWQVLIASALYDEVHRQSALLVWLPARCLLVWQHICVALVEHAQLLVTPSLCCVLQNIFECTAMDRCYSTLPA